MKTSPKTYSVEFLSKPLTDVLLVATVVFTASLFGILSRPVGFLAAIWPANAILLAMMVRNPRLSTLTNWIAAFVAFIAADLITGNNFDISLRLTFANIVGAVVGYQLFMRLAPEDRELSRPISIVCLLAISVLAAASAAAVGAGAALMLFERSLIVGFTSWFTTELVNMLIILPPILTWQGIPDWLRGRRHYTFFEALPVISLVVLTLCSQIIGGPGAFAYPIPALIWCALSYSLFTTATLTLCFSVIQIIALVHGFQYVTLRDDPLAANISLRIAIALIALGPLAVASVNAAREELLERLNHAATFDSLTGALSRGTFLERAEAMLINANGSVAVLMLDVDHFKSINDRYGHFVGDQVLAQVGNAAMKATRPGDLFGRLGGEEFAAILPGVSEEEALAVAERIRLAIESVRVRHPDGAIVSTSASLGLSLRSPGNTESFLNLLSRADDALYLAKERGRNCIEIKLAA